MINFDQEIPTSAQILIDASIRNSVIPTASIRQPIPLTIAEINSPGQGVLFDVTSLYLGSGATPGAIKLICTSVITGASGVQGMNVMVQSSNLAQAGDIIRIKGIYFKA